MHTKCISEDARYAAKGSKTDIVKKGEQKQENWTEMIKSIIDKEENLNPSHRNILSLLSDYSNIPKKKPRFMNFISNTFRRKVNMNDVEPVWNLIEKHKQNIYKNNSKKSDPQTEKLEKNTENEKKRKASNEQVEENGEESPKPKKLKQKDENQGTEDKANTEKFSFKDAIIEIVKKKGSISTTKLQKKVLNHYLKHTGETECSEKLIKKYNKKLNKIENLSIANEVVTLVENEV